MSAASAEFRDLLERGDFRALRAAWARVAPHLPQPKDDAEAERVMHHARTGAASIAFASRAWSHRWLAERALPSALPDALRPKAERLHPVVVEAVGIAVGCSDPLMKPATDEIRRAMSDAVEHCYADGRTDPAFVRDQIQAARRRTKLALFGRPHFGV